MRHLATGAYLHPTKLSLRRLVNLSQTELRKSITSLYIAVEHFDSCYTFEEWECLKVPPTWFEGYPTEEELHQRYSICRRAFTEQEDALNQRTLAESISCSAAPWSRVVLVAYVRIPSLGSTRDDDLVLGHVNLSKLFTTINIIHVDLAVWFA
jgi:hypothetical protein